MLKNIAINHYKSFRRAILDFSPFTVLIGANASGKSNAVETLRLLSWLAKGRRLDDIESSIQQGLFIRGNPKDLFNPNSPQIELSCLLARSPYQLRIGFTINQNRLIINQESLRKNQDIPLYEIKSDPKPYTDDISVAYDNFKRGGKKPQITCSNRQAVFYQLQSPARFDSKNRQSQQLIPRMSRIVRDTLRTIRFLEPAPSAMRGYCHEKDTILREDGSNLSAVLRTIHLNTDPLGEHTYSGHLLKFVKSLPEQDIQAIDFIVTERGDVMLRLRETFGGQARGIDAPLLSDGTLRVLSVAALMLSAPPESLVVIEEIDNGIHPSRAEGIIRHMEEIARLRDLRILLTTHNPALLDAIPPERLGEVLCCYRDPAEGDSRVVRLGGLNAYPELTARGPLGDLVTRGVLEKYLHNQLTDEARKAKALEWLRSIEAELPA